MIILDKDKKSYSNLKTQITFLNKYTQKYLSVIITKK